MTNVAIADDHHLIVLGLKGMLNKGSNINILFTVNTGAELLNELEKQQPEVLLLDIELPDSDGIILCKDIKSKYPSIKIIAVTNHDETVCVRKMMKNGADGYLLKGTDKKSLIEAIEIVSNNGQYIDHAIQKSILQETLTGKKLANRVKLTKRETEILTLIANEHSNQEIADKLFISIRTVESHRLTLTQKLNVRNTVGLVKEAFLRGLVN